MIRLEELHGDKGMRQKTKRLGRGESSGQGKTSGRGHKGAGSRSGGKKGKGFEGGQTPLSRRLPKRGFSHQPWDVPTAAVNISQLNRFEDGATISFDVLREAGLVGRNIRRVKILANGEIEKKLTVQADNFSEAAKRKIEAAGGSCEVVSAAPAAQK